MQAVKDAADALAIAQVIKATEQFIQVAYVNVAMLETMSRHKKPADLGFLMKQVGAINEEISFVKRKDLKAPPHHLQTVIDAVNIVSWVFTAGNDTTKSFC